MRERERDKERQRDRDNCEEEGRNGERKRESKQANP